MGAVDQLKFFRSNAAKLQGPTAVAEVGDSNLRVQAFVELQTAARRVLASMDSWRPFDATGHVDGAIGHTESNIQDLLGAVDVMQSHIIHFRRLQEQADGKG